MSNIHQVDTSLWMLQTAINNMNYDVAVIAAASPLLQEEIVTVTNDILSSNQHKSPCYSASIVIELPHYSRANAGGGVKSAYKRTKNNGDDYYVRIRQPRNPDKLKHMTGVTATSLMTCVKQQSLVSSSNFVGISAALSSYFYTKFGEIRLVL